jgi:hypothetical protein
MKTVEEINDMILLAWENFRVDNTEPPMLLILPFEYYYILQSEATLNIPGLIDIDYSVGHLLYGMVIDYDYDATEIVIKGAPK